MSELLQAKTVEAVFCGDDLICMGALDEARQSGIKVPEELGLIGFNDLEIAQWSAYDLTTIRQPTRDIIKSSIELIVGLVDEPDRALEARVFPCSVVERGTLKARSTAANT